MDFLSRLELYGAMATGKTYLANQLRQLGLVLIEIDDGFLPSSCSRFEHYGLPGCTAQTLASHVERLGHKAVSPRRKPDTIVVGFHGPAHDF